ncbi:hypothetical protein IscW_ISCW013807 [Ixodes scapularis]|uniref:Uncharacterized protein n=1 Tax=Ixodes scapularis TaxID=6945 RepID=B7QHS9_IXOSC|nr:hypothetical protein IscW_ISCW013807 [Ixodes scapularis]|eukprot:XP_002414736.1 hypothetical protein IscW_ISCW013807 [Ixodes scapularis]
MNKPALLPASVSEVVLNTGNILGCKELTKKVFQSLVEEHDLDLLALCEEAKMGLTDCLLMADENTYILY